MFSLFFPSLPFSLFLSLSLLDRGFADGHRQRLVEFERFEENLKETLSSSAIYTKFEKHHQRGLDILIELDDLLREEEHKILDLKIKQNREEASLLTQLKNPAHVLR